MNNLSPLVPQGSFLEQKSKARSRVKTAVFCVLALHIIPITMALLMQGCKKDEPQPQPTEQTAGPVELTNANVVIDSNVAGNPPATNPPPELPVPAGQDYVVKSGDTLTWIARNFGVTVRAIQTANPNVEPTRLRPGQTLHIPPPAPAVTTTSNTAAAPATEIGAGGETIYSVKSGDNLTKIAERFHTTVRALRSENNLTTDTLKVGQKLKIPASGTPTVPTPTVTTTNPM